MFNINGKELLIIIKHVKDEVLNNVKFSAIEELEFYNGLLECIVENIDHIDSLYPYCRKMAEIILRNMMMEKDFKNAQAND